MTEHGALSVLAGVQPGMQDLLSKLLADIELQKNDANSSVPFTQVTTIHFARFVLLPERTDVTGKNIPAQLAFTTNYDGALQPHLEELLTQAGPGLWKVFSCCTQFPGGVYNQHDLANYLLQHSKKPATFYVGVGYRSVQQIRQERLLREEIERFSDTQFASFANKSAIDIRNAIKEHIAGIPSFAWALQPEPEPGLAWKLKHYGKLVGGVLLLLVLAIALLPLLVLWLLLIVIDEIRDKPQPNIVTKEHLRALTDRETGMVQAQFSAVGNVKPGFLRRNTIQFLLWLTNFLAPYLFSKGKLSGIPTVHFARWLIINEGRQMLFLSNFDGNSESYLTDFINIAAKQLTLLFSHTINYPRTYLMLFGGAKDAKKFMEWARHHQVITNVWYTANKEVTVKNVFSNSRIRKGLSGQFTEKEATQWLSLI
ncbi:hypothetical protein SAMN05421788_112132 [Filimonas lacunae]|uniref:Uncharacterized protein n=1 Tax=Filimonas lacunae TaxID=477680 RepID=A0A173ML40_9BACT|nr:hypothetical protein [Filimonas lacunae]BAV08324.1 peroxidase [Filimonas lacunae]SIT33363.1 hypothetical protein SAMN05421788_112132 [Filimonas lacunae]